MILSREGGKVHSFGMYSFIKEVDFCVRDLGEEMRIKSHVVHISSAMVQIENERSTIMEKEVKLLVV